jgi:L-2-hydroxyglutarate oxidase
MRIAVVGGGIVGLAVARELVMRMPHVSVVVLEKEAEVATHQTGHNSGVIHAGIYYTPGSVKAQLCHRGAAILKTFCTEHHVPHRNLGKLVVALDETEKAGLNEIHRRALANGVKDVVMMDRSRMLEIEPHVAGVAALHSPSTAVVDFVEVAKAYQRDLVARGGDVMVSTCVTSVKEGSGQVGLATSQGELAFDHVIMCTGLQASRLAKLAGDDDDPRIIPFRGEYHRLRPQTAQLVNGLVYPVPDPRYPFLGIHLTRRINGTVDIGPNAVLASALEGYRRRDVSLSDLSEIVRWPGFLRMARKHWRTGAKEVLGSLSRRYFLSHARRYMPSLVLEDLEPMPAGVRAQAVRRDGSLVDDFWITTKGRTTLVRNAPSPAATSSLAIAEYICTQVADTLSS